MRIVLDDPDDDHVMAATLAARADLIVSGDTAVWRSWREKVDIKHQGGYHCGILMDASEVHCERRDVADQKDARRLEAVAGP